MKIYSELYDCNYKEFIENIDGEILTFKDVIEYPNSLPKKFFCIRHDADNTYQLKKSLHFAYLEKEMGWKSTYFFKNFREYKKSIHGVNERGFLKICKKIKELGHDIGLHIDIIKDLRPENNRNKNATIIKNYLNDSLNCIRNGGIEVIGCAAHGDPASYKYGFNYEIWKELNTKRNKTIGKLDIEKIYLKDYGLRYEAYFMDYNVYVCDSASVWSGIVIDSYPILYEREQRNSDKNIGLNALNIFNDMESGFLHLLIHPTKNWIYEK